VTRRLLAAFATVVLATAANAQGQAPPPRAPAPSTDVATGLTFPPAIAAIPQTGSVDYAQTFNLPDLGYSWTYATPGTMSATIYIYGAKDAAVPPGPSSLKVANDLQQAVKDIYGAADQNRYENVATVRGPEECKVGGHAFKCTTLTATTARDKLSVFMVVMVTGYKNRFLKLRLEWRRNSAPSQQAKDRFVQAFEQTLSR